MRSEENRMKWRQNSLPFFSRVFFLLPLFSSSNSFLPMLPILFVSYSLPIRCLCPPLSRFPLPSLTLSDYLSLSSPTPGAPPPPSFTDPLNIETANSLCEPGERKRKFVRLKPIWQVGTLIFNIPLLRLDVCQKRKDILFIFF